jgi:hypothetical protein
MLIHDHKNVSKDIREFSDLHVFLERNFQHRHRKSAGDRPWFYEPKYFISKESVDQVGTQIEQIRSGKKEHPHEENTAVDHAIDECMKVHEAADGNRIKANAEEYDDTGVFALLCRHDCPIFYANIDTAGEEQKYPIALLNHLFRFIPESATVCAFYDVGCVLQRDLNKVSVANTIHNKRD